MLALLNRKTYSRAAQRATSPEDSLTSKWRGRCAKDSLEALARLAFKSRHARPACPLLPAYYNQKNRTSSTYKRIQLCPSSEGRATTQEVLYAGRTLAPDQKIDAISD